MSLTIACACGQHYAVGEEYAGRQVQCPICGQILTVGGSAPTSSGRSGVANGDGQGVEDSTPVASRDSITVTCACGQQYATLSEYAGQPAFCPACGQVIVIPDPSTGSRVGPHLPAPRQAPLRRASSGVLGLFVPLFVVFLLIGGLVGTVIFLATQSNDNTLAEAPPSQVDPRPEPPATRNSIPKEKDREKPKKTEDPPAPAPTPPAPTPRAPAPLAPAPPRVPLPVVSSLPPPSEQPWRGHQARILQLAFTQDGKSVLTAAGGLVERDRKQVRATDSTLRRWDAIAGKENECWPMTETGVAAAAFSPDGRLAAVAPAGAGARGEVFIWELREKRQLRALAGHGKPVCCLAFSPDGKQLLSGGLDNLLLLWDVESGKVIQELKGHTSAPNQLMFAPEGKHALSAGMDHSARLWDLEGGRQLHQLTGHADIVWTVAFSPDGQSALTGGGMQQIPGIGLVAGARDHDIRLWDTSTGKERKRFSGHGAAVTALAFSRDGSRFLSGSHDGSLRFWDIESGKELRRFDGHDGRVLAIAFFPVGRRALSAGEDGKLRTWTMPLEVSDLIADLRGDNSAARLRAIAELCKRRDDARPAIAALFQALLHRDDKLRSAVLKLLRDLSPLDKDHVLRLDRLLQDRMFPDGRLFALDALAALGADAAPAAKSLLAAIEDVDLTVRRKAIKALAPVANELGTSGIRPLLKALRDRDKEISAAAETALEKMGTPGAEYVATLRDLLGEDGLPQRRYGLKMLGELKEAARSAVSDITARVTKEPLSELRVLALAALAKIAPRDRVTVQAAGKALMDREAAVCRQAAKTLAAAEAVPELLQALLHEDAEVAKTAGEALDRTKYEPAHAPLLTALLESKDETIRLRGIDALGKLGADGAEGVAVLCKILKSAEDEERKRVLIALRRMGPAASKAGPALAPLLKNKEQSVRFDVCETLIRTEATEATKALGILIDALRPAKAEEVEEEDSGKEREKARELLAGAGKIALKPLLRALDTQYAMGKPRTTMGVLNGVARLEILRVLSAMGPTAGRNDVLLMLASLERSDPFPGIRKTAREVRIKLQKKE